MGSLRTVGSGGLHVTLFPGWSPLREGYPFIKDWNDLAGAIARARGVNGINLSIQAGALVVSGTAANVLDHPFRVYLTSPTTISITPGFCAAMGSSSHIPVWWDTLTAITEIPRESKTITGNAVVLLRANYDADEVWQSTTVEVRHLPFDYTDTYLTGSLLLAAITFDGGVITAAPISLVTSSLSHSKCNIYHTWSAV